VITSGRLHATPEIETTSRRTGLQLGLAAVTEANNGDFTVKLKSKRDRDVEEVIEDVRGRIEEEEPAAKVEFVQLLQDMIGDLTSQPEPIVIKALRTRWKILERHGDSGCRCHRQSAGSRGCTRWS
jgi:multidrug efflux pump subunit AcrB